MSIQKKFLKVQFGTKMRIALYKKICSFIRQGVSIYDMIVLLEEKYEENKKGDIRAGVLRYWITSMSNGKTFSDSISDWVPVSEMMLVRSGEKSGEMENAILNAIEVTTAAQTMKNTIIGKMAYPVILLLVLFGMIYLFSTSVVPKLTAMKDPETWPEISKTLYVLADFTQHYGIIVILGLIGFATLLGYSLSRFTGGIRDKLDVLPPYSVYRTFQGSVFLISVAAMMKTGTPLADGIDEMKGPANKYMKNHLNRMTRRLATGSSQGKSLNAGLLDREVGMDIEIYDQTADFQSSMEEVGRSAIEAGIARISAVSQIMGTVMLLMVASYIGWVYTAFMALTQSIAK